VKVDAVAQRAGPGLVKSPGPCCSPAQAGSSSPAAEPSTTVAATFKTTLIDFRILLIMLSFRPTVASWFPDFAFPRTGIVNLITNAAETSTRKDARGIEPQAPAPSLNWRRDDGSRSRPSTHTQLAR
jgi:membrane-associated phospholipid phosphatase